MVQFLGMIQTTYEKSGGRLGELFQNSGVTLAALNAAANRDLSEMRNKTHP